MQFSERLCTTGRRCLSVEWLLQWLRNTASQMSASIRRSSPWVTMPRCLPVELQHRRARLRWCITPAITGLGGLGLHVDWGGCPIPVHGLVMHLCVWRYGALSHRDHWACQTHRCSSFVTCQTLFFGWGDQGRHTCHNLRDYCESDRDLHRQTQIE